MKKGKGENSRGDLVPLKKVVKSKSKVKPKPEGAALRIDGEYKTHPDTMYDPNIHDAQLKQILSKGLFPEDFCKANEICKDTFSKWRDDSASFRRAYRIGLAAGEAHWKVLPRSTELNHQYWMSIMQNQYSFTRTPIPRLARKLDAEGILEVARQELAEGNISPKIFDKLIMLANAKMRSFELNQLHDMVMHKIHGLETQWQRYQAKKSK